MRINSIKALFSFMYFNEAKLSMFASGIITAMTGNKNFTDGAALLAELAAAQAAYVEALSAAQDGSRMLIAVKNTRKAELLVALRKVCEMVNYVAQGDRFVLLSSGFELSKETNTPSVLMPAKSVVVKYGETSGQLDVSVQGVKGHKGLVFEYAVADSAASVSENNWTTKLSSKSSYTISNLPVGQKVVIRVGIAGSRNQVVYTEPVVKLVA